MRDECYLVLSEHGIERMTKRPGKLNRSEVSVKISVGISDQVFVGPALSATITIPDSAAIKLAPIDVIVFDAPEGKA